MGIVIGGIIATLSIVGLGNMLSGRHSGDYRKSRKAFSVTA